MIGQGVVDMGFSPNQYNVKRRLLPFLLFPHLNNGCVSGVIEGIKANVKIIEVNGNESLKEDITRGMSRREEES